MELTIIAGGRTDGILLGYPPRADGNLILEMLLNLYLSTTYRHVVTLTGTNHRSAQDSDPVIRRRRHESRH